MRRHLTAIGLVALVSGCSGAPTDEPSDPEATAEEIDWFESAAPPLGPEPHGTPAKYPIVLAHGFAASPENFWGFYQVKEALEGDGHKVIVARVSPFNSPEVRARDLSHYVDQALAGADKVHIVAHSMGGLDARVLVTGMGYAKRVASLTTISTPHHGMPVADVALKIPSGLDGMVNMLVTFFGKTFTSDDLADGSDLRAALEATSEANSAAFNETYPNAPGVLYESWAGISSILGHFGDRDTSTCGTMLANPGRNDKMHSFMIPGSPMVAHFGEHRPNDGMITVESAKWGTFRGCIPADHMDQVGQVNHHGADHHTGFDHLRFYRNLAFGLSARGM